MMILTSTGCDLTNMWNQLPILQVNGVQLSTRGATMDETHRQQGWWQSQIQDSTRPTREMDYYSYKSTERNHQSENKQFRAGSYLWISNTNNQGWCQRRLEVSTLCIPTTLAMLKKSRGQGKQQRQLGVSQNSGNMKYNFQSFISEPGENITWNYNSSNHPIETQVHKEATNPDDEDKDNNKGKDDSTFPDTEDNRGQDDILSKITEDDQKETFQQNRMPLELLFEQQAEWRKDRTRMLPELDRSCATDSPENLRNQSHIYKMVETLRYCGAAKELDKLRETSKSNFTFYKHLFRRGNPDQVNVTRNIHTHPRWLATFERLKTRR